MIIINSNKDAIKKIYSINNQFEILSEFEGWRKPIKRKCKICGEVKEVQARCLIERNKDGTLRRCQTCLARERGDKKRKTHNQFVDEMSVINPNIKFLSKYELNNKKIKCKCLIDGFEWEAIPHTLLRGHGCLECARRLQNRRNEEEFLEEFRIKQPDIEILSKFTKSSDMMKFKCKTCGFEWETQAYIPITRDGYGCPKCKNHAPVTEKEFIERLEKSNDFVTYISGYTDMTTHANFKCNKCGHIWDTIPASILRGNSCPKCNLSGGEKRIYHYLKNNNIDFSSQYIFDDCKYIRPLPFDFYIKSLNLCIEYDGIQHFEPTKFSPKMSDKKAYDNYITQVKKDNIKNDYCKKNNLKLLRIPYTDFNNIEKILNNYFLKQKWKRIYGISEKLGSLDMKGEIHTYQDMNNQAEKVHLMLKDFTYGVMLTHIENFAKITLN